MSIDILADQEAENGNSKNPSYIYAKVLREKVFAC